VFKSEKTANAVNHWKGEKGGRWRAPLLVG
jgi:hypothetical protein